ncbi:MAG: AAA family ATPase [Candidatus Tectimicrobiota bacterium]
MIYAFSIYELDLDRRELRRAGTPLRLEPKVFDLLAYLLRHHGHFVSRQALYEHLWPKQFVSEHALAYCVAAARKALGDSGRAQRLIKTLHGRGYCFIAPLLERPTEPQPETSAATPAAVATDTPSLAAERPPATGMPGQRPSEPPEALAWPPLTAERRQLTVLWCRGVVTAQQPRPLDAEELHQIWQRLQPGCDQVIARYEGSLAQHLGEGFVVYFGHPLAYEDAAHRAVYTALALLQESQRLTRHLNTQQGLHIALHVGIHTGPVVIGRLGPQGLTSPLALGETPRLATRLAQLAPSNSVVISAATLRLVAGAFTCQVLEAAQQADTTERLLAYQVLRASETRLVLGPPLIPPGPCIGREYELNLLKERWQQSQAGHGQLILLSGEPGIGKSRLVQAFHQTLVPETGTVLFCRCSPYYQHSALYPVIEYLRHCLHWHPQDTVALRLRTLEKALTAADFVLTETVPLFAALLDVPLSPRYPPLTLDPAQLRQHTLAALLAWLLKKTEAQPLCLVVEDLHWIDPSSLELLQLLVDQVPMARLLILLSSRPEFVPPWPGRSHVTHLSLHRLTDAQAVQLIAQVTVGVPLPQRVVQQVVLQSNGVPLFVEEMTKMALEAELPPEDSLPTPGPAALAPLAIPATLHDSLMARLDRQGTGKLVAQVGATLGREFSYSMLQAIAPVEEAVLRQGLTQLVNAEILYQRGLPPQAQYLFKHVLLQEAAYQSLLRQTRQHYHRHIAQILEERFPDRCASQPELLAHHYTMAGLHDLAIPYWQQAGQQAQGRSAHVEAIAHLRRGLLAATALPATSARRQQELLLYLRLGVSLMATQGYASHEVEAAYVQARDRCQSARDQIQLFTALRGLWLVYLVRGDIATAVEQGSQLLHIAQQHTEATLLLEAHRALGSSLFFAGELTQAADHLTQALHLYSTQQHSALTLRYGQDPGMVCLVYMAWILWLRGYPDQALAPIQQALTLAQECQHSFCLAFARTFAVMLSWCRRDKPAVATHLEASLALAQQQGFPLLVALGTVFQGSLRATSGHDTVGLAQIRQGLAAYRATGAELFQPYFLALLAEAAHHVGCTDEALAVLTEALTLMDKRGERLHAAELYRLQGTLYGQMGHDDATVVACFQQALSVARAQQAKALELRAALCLSRWWQQQGQLCQAYSLLAETLQWFQEGEDTGDVQEARDVLAQLRQARTGETSGQATPGESPA